MNLLVVDADRAVEYLTGIAIDLGGYLISSRMWQADGFKSAQVTIAIPSEQALAVNNHLTDVEAKLEQVKGREKIVSAPKPFTLGASRFTHYASRFSAQRTC